MIATYLKNFGKKIPSNSNLVLHVKLKGLIVEEIDHKTQSLSLLNMIREYLNPSKIFVPTFSYSFTKNLLFDISETSSEVGRFSEELRILYKSKSNRTPDPIFSFVETEKSSFSDNIFNNNAFGPNSIFEYLNNEPHYIVNLNLDLPILTSQLHYIEYKVGVPYRYIKNFKGVVVDRDNIKHEIDYSYFVRDKKIDPKWNRDKILLACQKHNLVLEYGPFKIFESTKFLNFFRKKLLNDNSYFINNED